MFDIQHYTDLFIQNSFSWLRDHGVTILIIAVGASIAQFVIRRLVERAIRRLIKQGEQRKEAEKKREDTLIQVTHGASSIIIWLVAGMMILSEFGIAIGPVLAAAGVAGLALGFGGQYLIRDLISGAFIIIENQYRTGDVVCFGSTCGLVETITLRLTTVRDIDGALHHVPHGEINIVSNLSKGFARVHLNIGIAYETNLEQVMEIIDAVGASLAEDPLWKDSILDAPKFVRIDEFADSAIIVKILGDTIPMKQWEVAGELRKRLKVAFDREGIEIPFPQRVITKKTS